MHKQHAQVVFLNINFNGHLTGIERASLLRAKIFHEQLQITPTLVTVRYNHLLRTVYENHIAKGTAHPEIPMVNMYEQFQGSREGIKQQSFIKNPHFEYKAVNGTNDYRVYREEKFIQYIKRRANGDLDYINHFSNGKKVGRYKYDHNGYLSVYQTLDAETARVLQEDFHHIDGSVRLRKYFRTVNEKHRLQSIVLFDEFGEIMDVFQSEDALIGYWLERYFDEQMTYYCFVDKSRIYYAHLAKSSKPNLKIISCIHAMHTKNPIEALTSDINRNYRLIFEDVEKPDAIVILTAQQKKDIVERFGEVGNYHVIPHAIDQLPAKVSWKERDPFKVVALARYSPEKRLDQMIEIFAKVVEKVPKATLDIYGFGTEKGKLLKRIQELHMTNHIFLKAYVDDVSEVYEKASLSLLTSRTEAFSLVTMESLAHGCPVISYDIKYGPSEMIEENKNGFLIQLDEQEAFAEKMIEILQKPRKLKKMSESAYRLREAFSAQQVSKKWQYLLDQVDQQSPSTAKP